MNSKEIRKRLLDETPEQWCVYLEMAEKRLNEMGFSSLREFIQAPVNRGGLGISLERARWLIRYNPAYEAKAERLLDVISVREEIKDELASGKTQQDVAEELGVNQKQVSRLVSKSLEPHKNARTLYFSKSPIKAAEKIKEKFGEAFALELKSAL